ncbi:MAG TPA: WD40 repeat domain-containing protein, partial [Gemmataceae bacterium]|nr:WD40 repeat domain-containing protein [Gemmataceae bacterium]
KITPVPGARGVADTAVSADPTVRVAAQSPAGDRFAGSLPQSRYPARRWPILGIAVVAVGITIGGVAAFRPKPRPSEPPIVVQYEPPPKLSEQPAGQIQQFIGHTEAIEKVAFTPDGKRLVTASKDKTVRVWDIATGRELRTLIGHTGIVRGLTVLPDNRRAATAGWDGTVRLWDLDTGEELRQYPGHKGQVWWVECDAAGRRLLTAGQDGTIRLWDVNAGTAIKVMGKHFGTATAAVFLADGKRAVSAGEDGNVFLWDLTTGDRIGRTRAPKMVYRLSLCPEGRWVLFGSDHWFLRWDPDGKLHPTRVPDVTDSIETVVGLPDGRLILAVVDGTIRLWQTKPERELHQFSANGQAVLSLAVAPDGKHFASAGRDKVARLWAIPTLSR